MTLTSLLVVHQWRCRYQHWDAVKTDHIFGDFVHKAEEDENELDDRQHANTTCSCFPNFALD